MPSFRTAHTTKNGDSAHAHCSDVVAIEEMGRDERDVRASEDVEVDVVGKVSDLIAFALDEENVIVGDNGRDIIGPDERLSRGNDVLRRDSSTDALE